MFSVLLMTNAVLFLGYSLGDPDLNLLLDSQLSAFSYRVPPRTWPLMMDVGEVQRTVMKQSAGIDVQSFPKGEYDSGAKIPGTRPLRRCGSGKAPDQPASRGGIPTKTDTGTRGLESTSSSSIEDAGAISFSIPVALNIVELLDYV